MPRMRSVLSRAGYPGVLSEASPDILCAVKTAYVAALDVVSPRALSWELEKDDLALGLIPPKLEKANAYTVLLATLGHQLDDKIAMCFTAGAPLEATLLDAWGSEAVEALVQNVDRRLRDERGAEKGTIRFAPGYGGFDVRNNAKWLELVTAKYKSDSGGVKADPETGVLSPRKSVLCMIGWEER